MTFALTSSPLHWQQWGNPRHPRLIFLHGFMGSNNDWEKIIANLASDYHCLAPDLPGHGQSLGLEPAQYAMAGTAQLLMAALPPQQSSGRGAFQNRADLVVGYSMGGRLALYLSLSFPQSFPQAKIISGSPGLASSESRESRRAMDLIRCNEIRSNLKVFLRFWYEQPLFRSLWKTSLPETLIEQRLSNNPEELCRSLKYLGLGAQPNLWQKLPHSEAKLHQIAGELDPKFVQITHQMADCYPELNWKILPEVGHNIPLENPSAIVSEIRQVMQTSNL